MKRKTFTLLSALAIILAVLPVHAESGLNQLQQKQVRTIVAQEIGRQPVSEPATDSQADRIANLENRIDEQALTINQLVDRLNEVQRSLEINADTISKVRETTKRTSAWVRVLRAVLVPVGLIVLVILGFFFWPRRTISPPSDTSARPKCPRCGLEHEPGDTICKNPSCQTRF